MNIVVVESPAKAKTINKYLGPWLRGAGLVRPCPRPAGQERLGRSRRRFPHDLGGRRQGQKRLADIASAVKGADKLILATDPDREGEAISWHVLEVLKEKNALKGQKIERVVFNAITKQAVAEAMKHPRAIDGALVDAYLARRALDYLVGFTLSPVLWRKLPGARSAGRVQSVALRLVVRPRAGDREVRRARILVAGRDARDAAQRHLRGAPRRRRRQEDPAPRHRHRRGGRAVQARSRNRAVHRRLGRGEARQAQSPAPVHHLDDAAGGEPQARLRAGAHHARRAAAL